jgi:hypothetical protein
MGSAAVLPRRIKGALRRLAVALIVWCDCTQQRELALLAHFCFHAKAEVNRHVTFRLTRT